MKTDRIMLIVLLASIAALCLLLCTGCGSTTKVEFDENGMPRKIEFTAPRNDAQRGEFVPVRVEDLKRLRREPGTIVEPDDLTEDEEVALAAIKLAMRDLWRGDWKGLQLGLIDAARVAEKLRNEGRDRSSRRDRLRRSTERNSDDAEKWLDDLLRQSSAGTH